MVTTVLTSVIEVTDALAELGLSFDILREAMLVGELARDSCTGNDPPNAAGFDAWARTVKALRELLIPQRWTRNDDANFSRVINPDKAIAIAVATGDEGTGNSGATPKTNYPKGPATVAAIDGNRKQLKLFEPDDIVREERHDDGIRTWMLVRRRAGEVLFSELSLPAKVGEDGRIEGWANRIVFQPITLEPDPVPDQNDQGEEIEVQVRRRS